MFLVERNYNLIDFYVTTEHQSFVRFEEDILNILCGNVLKSFLASDDKQETLNIVQNCKSNFDMFGSKNKTKKQTESI